MISSLLNKLNNTPERVSFNDVMEVISHHYHFTETPFTNGNIKNLAGSNNGSCKIFAFAQLNKLSKAKTLACFGDYYRQDVLQHPEADDHGNIRNFMVSGWQGIKFNGQPLTDKSN